MNRREITTIERFLGNKGIDLQVKRQPPCHQNEVASAEIALGHCLPQDLKDIYLTFANGFEVFWKEVGSQTDFDFGRFSLPSLGDFVETYKWFHNEIVEQHANAQEYFDRIDDARSVLQRMLNWAVLWSGTGDGDLVCIDLENGAILFHEREWSFYKTYVNGYLIAPSLNRLIEDWGNVCFLWFCGCAGHCPAHGSSAVPDYEHQKFNMAIGRVSP